MQYATYVRQPRARKYILHSVVPVEAERSAYRAALQTLPRRQGDVEQFPVPDGYAALAGIATAGIAAEKAHVAGLMVAANVDAATAIVTAGVGRKFDAGTDYGLALAVQRILRDSGQRAFMSKSFALFGDDSSKYEVSVL